MGRGGLNRSRERVVMRIPEPETTGGQDHDRHPEGAAAALGAIVRPGLENSTIQRRYLNANQYDYFTRETQEIDTHET